MMECPNCKAALAMMPAFPENQVMYFSIKHEYELLMAKTVSGTMASADKLLQAIGKEIGVKVQVFLHSVEQKPNELTFGLLMITKSECQSDQAPELEKLRANYNELLYSVHRKTPGETRHETALRYIKQMEAPSECAFDAVPNTLKSLK